MVIERERQNLNLELQGFNHLVKLLSKMGLRVVTQPPDLRVMAYIQLKVL